MELPSYLSDARSLTKRKMLIGVTLFLIFTFFLLSVPAKADYVQRSGGTLNLSFNPEAFSGLSKDDEAYSIVQVPNSGSVMVAGYTESFGAGGSDMWLIKTRQTTFPLGNAVLDAVNWEKTYGGPQDDGAECIVPTVDGGFALAGYTKSFGSGGSDMFLVKVDSNGTLLWNMTYGGPKDEGANGIVQKSDGGYVLAGYTSSYALTQSTWLVMTDSSGRMQSSLVLPGLAANSIVQTTDGGYVLATKTFNAFGLVKLDSSGNLQWNQTYAGPNDGAEAQSAIQTSDGGYAIAGWTAQNSTGSVSAWLIKTDSTGNLQWQKTFPQYGAYSIVQMADGGYALTGDQAFLILTDSSGNMKFSGVYNGLSEDNPQFTRTYCVALAGTNQVLMAGVQQSYGQIKNGLEAMLIRVTLANVNDTTPPALTILAPENKIYTDGNIPLTFTTSKPVVWMAYAVDNGRNVTISGNTTITGLADGRHNMTVYAQDADYNNGASRPVFFQNFVVDTVPVNITTTLMHNGTYDANTVPLSYAANKPVSWATFSLDGQENKTLTQNTVLTELAKGVHTLTVYAADELGLVGASGNIQFTVTPELMSPSPLTESSPSPVSASTSTSNPSASPPSTSLEQPAQPQSQPVNLPMELIYAVAGAAVVLAVAVVVLTLGRRKQLMH
jgi:hypothetical protein